VNLGYKNKVKNERVGLGRVRGTTLGKCGKRCGYFKRAVKRMCININTPI
jgi:hypothetical protein